MTEQGFYNFSQYKSKDLGHHNVVHLLQNPTPLIIKAISLGIFFFSVVFLSFIDSTPLHFLVSLSISILFYFLAKFCWARKLLSPFNIPLWGDFESMILKTVIIPEMTENEKNIFKSICKKIFLNYFTSRNIISLPLQEQKLTNSWVYLLVLMKFKLV